MQKIEIEHLIRGAVTRKSVDKQNDHQSMEVITAMDGVVKLALAAIVAVTIMAVITVLSVTFSVTMRVG